MVVAVEESDLDIEPGSVQDYNQQQYQRLQAKGKNCTDLQFAVWYSTIIGGNLCAGDTRCRSCK